MINVIIRRYNRRRHRIDFALSVRLRRDNVWNQSDDDFRNITLDVIQSDVYFFHVNDICFLTINVDNKTSTRWKRNNDVETSISSINLLRNKLLILLMRCSLQLFKNFFFKVVRIFMKTSRRFMNDDITSIRAEIFYAFKW